MRNARVEDVRLLDAAADRIDTCLRLRYHPRGDDARPDQPLNLRGGQGVIERLRVALIAQYAAHICQEDELLRLERYRDLARHIVAFTL